MSTSALLFECEMYHNEMGEGEISPFIYLPLGGSPKYDIEELKSIQLILRCGRAELVVTASPRLIMITLLFATSLLVPNCRGCLTLL